MTLADPDDANANVDRLIESLGQADWRARKSAVTQLSQDASEESTAKVLGTLRDAYRDLPRLNAAIQVLANTQVDVVPALLQLLSEGDADLRSYVSLTLGERGDPRAIPALLTELADANTNVRVHAIEALGKLRAAAAVIPLIELIESGEFEVGFPALDALIAIDDPHIAERLFPLLRNELLGSRTAEALGLLGHPLAVEPLLELLGDPAVSPAIIAKAIKQIHDRCDACFGDGATIVSAVRQFAGRSHLEALYSAAPGASADEATAIIEVIGWMADEKAEALLFELLDSPAVRLAAMKALVQRGAPNLATLLERAELEDADDIRVLIEVCGRSGRPAVVSFIVSQIDSDQDGVALAAFQALQSLNGDQLYLNARTLLNHPSARLRQAAADVLVASDTWATSDDLKFLQAASTLTRESVLRALGHIELPEVIESVLLCCDDPNERVRRAAIDTLARSHDPRAVARLTQALGSDTSPVRAAAAAALGAVDATLVGQSLQQALQDQDVWVRYYAAQSLSHAGYQEAAFESLKSLALQDSAMQVRIAAAKALGRHGDRAIPLLTSLAAHSDSDLASAAIAGLGQIHHPEASLSLTAALHSSDSQVQSAAIQAFSAHDLPHAVDQLALAASSQDRNLAELAIAGLGNIRRAESVRAILRIAENPLKRAAVVRALLDLGDSAIPQLALSLPNAPLDVRRMILAVVSQMKSAAGTELLTNALDDPEPAVRYLARAALQHFAAENLRPRPTGPEGTRQ